MADHPTRRLNQPGPEPGSAHPPQRLTEPRPCLRCGQLMVSAYALARWQGGATPIYISSGPEETYFKKYPSSPCFALVCPQCGYTELFTVNAQAVLGADT